MLFKVRTERGPAFFISYLISRTEKSKTNYITCPSSSDKALNYAYRLAINIFYSFDEGVVKLRVLTWYFFTTMW